MNLQHTMLRRLCVGVYGALLLISIQPGIAGADEDGERERLTLYDRNKRTVRWQQERKDYFEGFGSCRARERQSREGQYDVYSGHRRYHGVAEEPDIAPPE